MILLLLLLILILLVYRWRDVLNLFCVPRSLISFHYCSDFQPMGTSHHAIRHDIDCWSVGGKCPFRCLWCSSILDAAVSLLAGEQMLCGWTPVGRMGYYSGPWKWGAPNPQLARDSCPPGQNGSDGGSKRARGTLLPRDVGNNYGKCLSNHRGRRRHRGESLALIMEQMPASTLGWMH